MTTPPDYPVRATPRISPALFHEVLTKAGSPALPENAGDTLWRIAVDASLDPAVALAFFQHESTYGTRGLARTTKSWGNQRRSPTGLGTVREIPGRGPFAHFRTWADSLRDWCAIINGPVYAGAGRATVGAIVPVYAPSSDGNVPARYVRAVCTAVAAWEALTRDSGWQPGGTADPWAAWGTRYPLPAPQRAFAIPQRWLREGDLGAARSTELYADDGPTATRSMQWFEKGLIVWLGGERTEVVR